VKLTQSPKTPTALLLLMLFFLAGCANRQLQGTPVQAILSVPDYAASYFWAAHPLKNDPSDRVPAPLQAGFVKDSSVDVFFVHPTSFTGADFVQWNADLMDSALNNKTDESSIYYQASVFNQYNVYAPRYRQAHVQSYYSADTVRAMQAFDLAYSDVRAAFEYYLANENHGRPIIIASHSQGTTHAKRLLKEFFEGRLLQQKLVAAYLIGMPVEPDYFSTLQPCKDSSQTGCFVCWRTFRKGFEPNYQPSSRRSIVVNPLSWITDTSYAPVSLHKGAVLTKFNRIEPLVNDAQVYKDLLWISRPKFPHSAFYKARNYHIGDINLFYMNVRENLRLRVAQYKLTTP
jgi:Protein of unknown function (DUF3089)